MRGLDVGAAARVLVELALGRLIKEQLEVLNVLKCRASVERHLRLAPGGEGAEGGSHQCHLRRLADGVDVAKEYGYLEVEAADDNDLHLRARLAHRVVILLCGEFGKARV